MAVEAPDRIHLAFDDTGGGEPALLLVHGHPFDRSMWTPQMAEARRVGWRAIAPDLRGYGASAATPGIATLDMLASDVIALMGRLEVGRAVVCGLSMGGQVAMEICRQAPDFIAGLLLAATSPRADSDARRQARLDAADRIERDGVSEYANELLPTMVAAAGRASGLGVENTVLAMMRGANARGAAAALRGRAQRPGYESVLRELDVPALVVVGSDDFYTTREGAEATHQLLRRGDLAWLEGVGHLPNLEDPARFNAEIARLMQRVTQP